MSTITQTGTDTTTNLGPDFGPIVDFPKIETRYLVGDNDSRPGMPDGYDGGEDWRVVDLFTVMNVSYVREEMHGWEFSEVNGDQYYVSVAPGYRDSRIREFSPDVHVF